MKKMVMVIYHRGSEVGEYGMKEILNTTSYKNKTIKELIDEMEEKDFTIRFKYREKEG